MSDATSEDQAPSAAEDGELSPSSASPSAKAPDRLPPIEATPVEEAVAVLAEVLPAGDRERTRQIIKTLMGWSGPLPPPDELQEYGQAAPGAAELILADFQQRSELEIEATRHRVPSTESLRYSNGSRRCASMKARLTSPLASGSNELVRHSHCSCSSAPSRR